jgi:DNA-binding NarL/FixJ family response regulator
VHEAERLARRARLALQEVGGQQAEADPLAGLGLTGREREVLLLLSEGRSNPEIARELFISPKTASVHVSNILTKLGLSSRVQAAAVVHRLAPPGS